MSTTVQNSIECTISQGLCENLQKIEASGRVKKTKKGNKLSLHVFFIMYRPMKDLADS